MASDPALTTAAGPATLATLATRLTDELRSLGSPERAASERAYLESRYTHFGTSALRHFGTAVPKVRHVAKTYLRLARPSHDELVALVDELWHTDVYERRLLGVELVLASPKTWSVDDLLPGKPAEPVGAGPTHCVRRKRPG